MTDATFALAAGCLLQIAEARLEPSPTAWIERTHLEIAADPTCAHVDVPLAPGASLGEARARVRLGDGGGYRLGDERWERGETLLDGRRVVTLHLPELLGGDRVIIDLERHLPPGPVRWRPGAPRWWDVEVAGDASVVAVAEAPGQEPIPPPEPLGPPGDVRVTQRLTLQVPPGDPQVLLYPGGGSSVRVETWLVFPPGERARGWVVPAPEGAAISLESEPTGLATLTRDASVPRVRVEATEAPVRVTVAWEEPDAPTFGERPPHVDELVVEAPGGLIEREGDAWRLVGVNERPVLPSREGLVRALGNRFRAVSLPEPGAPTSLRGREPGWELAADLRPALHDRVTPATWPARPLWPRKLVKARRSLALTRTEMALTLWLYARQLRLDADWALARPATLGRGPAQSPAGFTQALVRVTHQGEDRWIDPVCTVCGPFELPPDLEGASVLGVDGATPPPTPGRHLVTVRDGEVEWQLQGPPALLLRMWLAELPEHELSAALASHVGGVGARLVALEGLERAGAPIRVVTTRGDGALVDPIRLPVPRDDGTAWVPWVGERRVEWPDHDLPDASVEAGPLRWSRTRRDDRIVERLVVDERLLAAADVAEIDRARYAPPQEPE